MALLGVSAADLETTVSDRDTNYDAEGEAKTHTPRSGTALDPGGVLWLQRCRYRPSTPLAHSFDHPLVEIAQRFRVVGHLGCVTYAYRN
jgi:hypothetical protein